MRLLLLIFASCLPLSAQVVIGLGTGAPAEARCATMTSACGYDGDDPYSGESAKSVFDAATAMGVCDGATLSAGNYQFRNGVDTSVAGTAVCKALANGVHLDLNGGSIRGRFTKSTSSGDNISVFHGTVTCDRSGGNCIDTFNNSATMTTPQRIHHIRMIRTDSTPAVASITYDNTATTTNNTGQTYDFLVYNMQFDGFACSGCSRASHFDWIGNTTATLKFYGNICSFASNQTSGQCLQQSGGASNLFLIGNYCSSPTIATESIRCMAFNANTMPGLGDITKTRYNFCNMTNGNGRCIRDRARVIDIYYEWIMNPGVTLEGTGPIHDFDQQQNSSQDYCQTTSYCTQYDQIITLYTLPSTPVFYGISGRGTLIGPVVRNTYHLGSGTVTGTLAKIAAKGGATCTLTSITWAAGVATGTCNANHLMTPSGTLGGCTAGQGNEFQYVIDVTGASPSGYNQTQVTVKCIPSATTFSYALAVDPGGSSSSGSILSNANSNWCLENNYVYANPNFATVGAAPATANGTTSYFNSGVGTTSGAGTGTLTNTLVTGCPSIPHN